MANCLGFHVSEGHSQARVAKDNKSGSRKKETVTY